MIRSPILEINELVVDYPLEKGIVRAVDGISLSLFPGEILGLVGESGCGKSTLGFSILGLLKGGKISKGSILFKNKELSCLSEKEMNTIRGPKISMIFQASQNALNPLQKVSSHFIDTLKNHNRWTEDTWNQVIGLIDKLEIPRSRLNDYPFQFSGGMQQRIVIALTFILRPELIIADEPTTALDVLVQARILNVLKELIKELNLTVIYITHDLGVVADISDRVAIMYSGEIVEISDTASIFHNPAHPYTKALISSIPSVRDKSKKKFSFIPGHPPDLSNLPQGCRFFQRCSDRIVKCEEINPKLVNISSNHDSSHFVSCLMYEKDYCHLFPKKSD